MRCDEKLASTTGLSAFFAERFQQARMQKILRLLNPDKARWLWIIKHHEVSKHLESTVRGKARQDRFLERSIFNPQQQAAIRHFFRQYALEPGHTPTEGP